MPLCGMLERCPLPYLQKIYSRNIFFGVPLIVPYLPPQMFRAFLNALLRAVFTACIAVDMAAAQSPVNLDSLIAAAARAATDSARVRLYLELADVYRDTVTKEFYYANEASALAAGAHWAQGVMDAERLVGDCYIKVLAYKDAIGHFQTSIAASERARREDGKRIAMQLMIHCYHMLDSLELATAYQKILLDLTAKTPDRLNETGQMSAYAQRRQSYAAIPKPLPGWSAT